MHQQWRVGSARRPNEVLPGEQACSLSPIVAARYSGNNAPTPALYLQYSVLDSVRPPAVFAVARISSYPAFISDFKSAIVPGVVIELDR